MKNVRSIRRAYSSHDEKNVRGITSKLFNYPRLTVIVEQSSFRQLKVEEPAFRPALGREIRRALAPVERAPQA